MRPAALTHRDADGITRSRGVMLPPSTACASRGDLEIAFSTGLPSAGGVSGVVRREQRDPGIGLALGARVAQIVHRRTARDLPWPQIERTEHPVPEEVRDAEVALLAVEVVRQMMSLQFAQPAPARHERQVL